MNKKVIYTILAVSFVIFLILALIFNSRSNNAIENSLKSLNEFSGNEENKSSYIYVDDISEDNNGYLIVFSDDKQLIVYLNKKLLNQLKGFSFDNKGIKLVGNTKLMTYEIMNRIQSIYNIESSVGDEDYLEIDNFTDTFGSYYLDVIRIDDDNTLYRTPAFLSGLFLDISLICLLILALKLMIDRKNSNNI